MENIDREIKTVRHRTKQFPELKNKISKMKSSLDKLDIRLEQAEERVVNLKRDQ